jgi:serine/threonine protein kinase/predicted ATPase
MKPDRWQQIDELFHAAVERAPHERAAFLDEACAGNDSLRLEVESLLAADSAAEEMATAKLPANVAAEMLDKPSARVVAGQLLNQYRIISPIGAGGMGEVFLAEDTRLKRHVAVKLLPAQFTNDADRLRRFEQEALAISALNHPNIITIHEIGDAPAGRFLVMEHVAGRTLRALAAENVPLNSLFTWGGQIAKALGIAHMAGITHRDIKPENIMVRDDGYVKVLDFGLARLNAHRARLDDEATLVRTNPGVLLGTVKYMAPEQARGETAESAADVFALGVVLYELATGEHPFKGGTLLGVLQAITMQAPLVPSQINPEIPVALDALLLRMLDKDARARPAAQDVAAALLKLERAEEAGNSATTVVTPPLRTSDRLTVGRERERAELRTGLESAQAGKSLLMCVAGEPGMGKTTLVEEFLAALAGARNCRIARGRCSERLAGTEAYLPLLEALDALLRSDRDGSCTRTMRQVAPTWYAQVATLGEENSSAARLLEEVRNASQERMKRELAALLQTLSQAAPLVLFFDDLHWADISTIDLLGYLASKFDTMRLLIVVTYRPSDLLLAKHPFLHIRPDLQARGLCRELTLGFLSLPEIETYFALKFPQHHFPNELAQLIHAKTEGNPLFMTDLVRYLKDRGVLAEQTGQWVLAQPLPDIERELPESVRGMVERKIAQLSEEDRKLLVAASVQGYEFDSAVVAAALQLDAGDVEEQLEKLERVFAFVKLVSESEFPNRTLTLKYRFVHVLYQNALYATLRATRKAALSRAVAQSIEEFYGEQRASLANELALLWEAARAPQQAADYFLLGAQQAIEIFATHEAGQLAQRALALLQQMPENQARQQRELPLQVILGNFFLTARGLAAPETAKAYDRIRELSQQTGDTRHLLPMLYGQISRYVFKPDFDKALEVCQEFRTIAEQQHEPIVFIADRLAGTVTLFKGELNTAREYFEKCLAVYDPALHQSLAWRYGSEPGMLGYGLRALTLWLQGYPEQALADSQESLRLAAAIPHAHTQTFAFMYAAMLHQFLRAPQQALALTEQQIGLCEKQGLEMLQAIGITIQACAKAEQGAIAAGIEGIRQGLERLRATGANLFRAPYHCMLAGLYGKVGQVNDGLAALTEAQAAVEQHEERWWEAELYRLRGDLLLQRGAASMEAGTEAEASLQQALAIAGQQGTKSLELRAAMSLARPWQQQGKAAEARQMLAGIYGLFTEGFDTPDLQEAKTLLDSLS